MKKEVEKESKKTMKETKYKEYCTKNDCGFDYFIKVLLGRKFEKS